jgi:hypothetical protein
VQRRRTPTRFYPSATRGKSELGGDHVLGDYGFARGTDTLTQEENGKTVQEISKWMATYRRQPDGPGNTSGARTTAIINVVMKPRLLVVA